MNNHIVKQPYKPLTYTRTWQLYWYMIMMAFGGLEATAQSSLSVTNISDGNSPVVNSYTLYVGIDNNSSSQIDFNVTNTSANTTSYKVRRYEDLLNPGGAAYFCFNGTCYTPTTFVSPTAMTLTTGQDAISLQKPIQLHYDEAPSAGLSNIRYHIYNTNDANDVFVLTISYSPSASLKNNHSVLSSVSAVYPNPASNQAFIAIQSNTNGANVAVTITNALGSVVSTKNSTLALGKNVLGLDSENLNSGIYFVTLVSGSTKYVKKFIIH